MKYIKVKDTTLGNQHKCSVCCVIPDTKTCAKFEFENGFDCCTENNHHYVKVEK